METQHRDTFIQYYDNDGCNIAFVDLHESHHATKCQPRYIIIVQGEDSPRVKERIAIDIRLGQGYAVIGIAKGLLFE